MNELGKDKSVESSSSTTAPSWSSKRLAGMWLSLKTPKSFKCSLCERSFASLQALGGHQNAHRKERTDMYRKYMVDMGKIGQTTALSPTPVNAISLLQPARINEAAAFELRQFQVQPRPQTIHQFLPYKNVNATHENPYGVSLGNRNFVPFVQPQPSLFDELTRSKGPAGTNADNKTLNLFPNDDFNVNAGSFADGADENEVTSEPMDLNLRL